MRPNASTPVSRAPATLSLVRRKRLKVLILASAIGLLLMLVLWIHPFWGFPFNSQRHGPPPLTPPWALECWLWEDDANTAKAVHELLEGYRLHDIPVRTVLLDSPWSTQYNDFNVDTNRYPNPKEFFGNLQSQGYRVVLWMTCLVNSRNKDTARQDSSAFFNEAQSKGYLAGNGRQTRWWKGKGGFIDYSNPAAMSWWHGLQQPVFDLGIDGWKLDGADSLFLGPGFIPYQSTHKGLLSTREYMDLYNREEYRHGLQQNPEFIILTRAIDNRYFPFAHPEGFAPLDAAPVTWVGDRTHQWSSKKDTSPTGKDAILDWNSPLDRGFEGAIRDILASAEKGYCVVGDDIAGYHGPEPIPPRLYIRWAQFATFTGLFLNGGHGERRLWKRSPQELEIIRRFAWLHTELVPYMFTHVVRCHRGGRPLIRPTAGRYHYFFGDDLLIAPIYQDETNHTVELPPGTWRNLLDDRERIQGPTTLKRSFTLEEFPAYVREGAIIPSRVSRPYTGFGTTNSTPLLTWVIYPNATNHFDLHHPNGTLATRATVRVNPQREIDIAFQGTVEKANLRIRLDTKPSAITRNQTPLVEGLDWTFNPDTQRLIIHAPSLTPSHYRILP